MRRIIFQCHFAIMGMNDGLAERKPKPKTSAAVANRMRSLDGDEDRHTRICSFGSSLPLFCTFSPPLLNEIIAPKCEGFYCAQSDSLSGNEICSDFHPESDPAASSKTSRTGTLTLSQRSKRHLPHTLTVRSDSEALLQRFVFAQR